MIFNVLKCSKNLIVNNKNVWWLLKKKKKKIEAEGDILANFIVFMHNSKVKHANIAKHAKKKFE